MEENFQHKEIKIKLAPLANLNPIFFIILTFFVVFITYVVIGGVLSALISGGDLTEIKDLQLTRLTIPFTQFMFLFLPAIVLSYLQGNEFKTFFRLNAPKKDVFVYSLIGIACIQPTLPLYVMVQDKVLSSIPGINKVYYVVKDLYESIDKYMLNIVSSYSISELLLVIFIIAITPAICEEFLFRGLILKNLERIASKAVSIIICGILFGLFHFQILNTIPLITLGIYLSLIVICTNSLYTGIICHFISNCFAALQVYIYGRENFTGDFTPDETTTTILLGIPSLILSCICIYFIIKFRYKKPLIIQESTENLV